MYATGNRGNKSTFSKRASRRSLKLKPWLSTTTGAHSSGKGSAREQQVYSGHVARTKGSASQALSDVEMIPKALAHLEELEALALKAEDHASDLRLILQKEVGPHHPPETRREKELERSLAEKMVKEQEALASRLRKEVTQASHFLPVQPQVPYEERLHENLPTSEIKLMGTRNTRIAMPGDKYLTNMGEQQSLGHGISAGRKASFKKASLAKKEGWMYE